MTDSPVTSSWPDSLPEQLRPCSLNFPQKRTTGGGIGLRADIRWKQDPLGVVGRRFCAYEAPYSFAMWESLAGRWGYDVTDRGAWPPQLLVRTTAADMAAARAECQRVWDELRE